MKLEFSRKKKVFKKIYKQQNFMTIRPVGTELFHEGGRTDMTKQIVSHCPKITKFRGQDRSST